jgi:hypothetical protein
MIGQIHIPELIINEFPDFAGPVGGNQGAGVYQDASNRLN